MYNNSYTYSYVRTFIYGDNMDRKEFLGFEQIKAKILLEMNIILLMYIQSIYYILN